MALDTFGKRLRVLRVDREMSQLELRDKMEKCCGVSIGETYISELERTMRTPTLEVAGAMARVLDISLDYLGLVIDDPVSYKRDPAFEGYISEEADQVAQLVDKMDSDKRAVVLNVARNLSTLSSGRQRRQAESRQILDSIEKKHGRMVREEIEALLRRLLFDGDA